MSEPRSVEFSLRTELFKQLRLRSDADAATFVAAVAVAHKSNNLALKVNRVFPREQRKLWRAYSWREFFIRFLIGGR